jgi:hypothetical protein
VRGCAGRHQIAAERVERAADLPRRGAAERTPEGSGVASVGSFDTGEVGAEVRTPTGRAATAIEPVEAIVEKLRAVTADDLLRLAQRLLLREKAALALVGPEAEEGPLLELLGA